MYACVVTCRLSGLVLRVTGPYRSLSVADREADKLRRIFASEWEKVTVAVLTNAKW